MSDITEKEWNQKYLPFYNNFSKYMINYIIPNVVAFYIANSYSRKCLCDSPLYNHINSAKDVFNINCDTKKLIPKIEKVENVEIKNRHKSLLDTKFKDDKTIFCDIANIDSNKGNAVKKLLEILNIKKEETIAIGDDVNDLSMFEQVGYKVAVDNAIDIVKEKADEITLSNDEDGVAVFLNKLLKNIHIISIYF